MNANYNYSAVYFSEGVSSNVFAISQMINYLAILMCVAFVITTLIINTLTLITYYIFPFFVVNLHLLQII